MIRKGWNLIIITKYLVWGGRAYGRQTRQQQKRTRLKDS